MMKKDVKPKETKSFILKEGVEDGEETEVAAQVHIPPEGGWSWVVLAASFFILFIIDGCCMSFGAMLKDISTTLKIPISQVALIYSIEVFLYFTLSPVSSALINRFGFRTVAMMGSLICSVGLFATYFGKDYKTLLVFLGIVTGIGCSFISMAAGLIVGFYFEKHRSIAMSICTGGSAAGTMTLYPVTTLLVKQAGFKNALLLQAGLNGIVYFLCLTFRPLLSLTVTQVEEAGNPTRTVTFLPTIAAGGDKGTKGSKATTAERMIGAVSNAHFPTVAQFFQEAGTTTTTNQPEQTSTSAKPGVSRITLQAQGEVNTKQLKQIQSIVSRITLQSHRDTPTEITIEAVKRNKKPWYRRCFDWEPDLPASRPMYRDDAFYDGKIEKLPVYQKSVASIKPENRTGLEYQLAVSRAVRVDDVQQGSGCCPQAVRRIVVSMIDPSLLKRKSFLLFCISGLLTNFGVYVPYVFIQDRNLSEGISSTHCSLFVSVMSFCNLLGRLLNSFIAAKISAAYLYSVGLILTGVVTIVSDVSYTVGYQYVYSALFGYFSSVSTGLRGVTIVLLYGLEHLTNATGVMLMFLGVGNLVSTPLGGALKKSFGYAWSFRVAGIFILAAGVVSLPVSLLAKREGKKQQIANEQQKGANKDQIAKAVNP